MKPRFGKSLDYNNEQRAKMFRVYYELYGSMTMSELANEMGVSSATSIYQVRKSKWWNDLLKEEHQSQSKTLNSVIRNNNPVI